MTALQAMALALVALGGAAVVLQRDPTRQSVLAGLFGLALAGATALQSGHVGDYVAWLTLGTAVFGAAFAFTLR